MDINENCNDDGVRMKRFVNTMSRIYKKMKRVIQRRIIFAGLVFSSFIGFVFSFIYYFHAGNQSDVIFGFYYSVMNTMKMLLFAPVISLKDAKELLTVYPMLTYLYGASVLVGPGCMLTAIIVRFFCYVHNIMRKWYVKASNRVYVFGYNNETKQLVSKLSEEGKRVIWIVREPIKQEVKEDILWNNRVFLVEMDLVSLSVDDDIEDDLKKVQNIFNRIGLAGGKAIILYEKEEVYNFELYLKLDYYFRTYKITGVKCSIYCENDYFSKNIDNLNQQKHQMDIYFFDLHDIAVQMMFDENLIYQRQLEKQSGWDMHFLLIGFGKYGKAVLKQVLYRSALSSQNNIVIDILEKQTKDAISEFTRFISENTYELDDDGTTIRIREGYMDGTLEIHFHEVDVRNRKFLTKLKDIRDRHELDYAAITLNNSALSLQCMKEVRRVFGDEPTIAIQLDEGDMLNAYCDNAKKKEHSFGNLKKTLSYEHIFQEEIMKRAQKKYYAYINKTGSDESGEREQKWRELSFEEKLANYNATFNDRLYRERLSMMINSKDENLLKAFIEQRESEESKVSLENPIYKELCGIEHKRWFLNKWLAGYYYLPKEKQKEERLGNKNMVCFSKMDADMIRKDWENVKSSFEK